MEDITKTLSLSDTGEFATEMEHIHMKWYVFGAFFTDVLFIIFLTLLCRFKIFDWWFVARAERKKREREEREAELKELMKEEF